MGFGLLLCIVPLYWAKTKADYMRDNMQNLRKDVSEEQKKISELEAEMAYLARFDRLEAASKRIGMKPIDGSQLRSPSELELIAPLHTPKDSIASMEQSARINNENTADVISNVDTNHKPPVDLKSVQKAPLNMGAAR